MKASHLSAPGILLLLAACSAPPDASRMTFDSRPWLVADHSVEKMDAGSLARLHDLQGVYCYDLSDSDLDPPAMGSSVILILPAVDSSGEHVWYDVFCVGSGDSFFAPCEKVTHYHMHRQGETLTDAKGEWQLHLRYKKGKVDGFYELTSNGADAGTWVYYSKQRLRHRYGKAGRSSERSATPPPLHRR